MPVDNPERQEHYITTCNVDIPNEITPIMAEKILFVDDEQQVLDGMKRQLRKRFSLQTALSGEVALQILKEEGPFSVIVSDMRMPGMDGVQLLSQVKEAYPDITRLMLTGNSDQDTAMEAVNKGQIFRFLTKPCSTATLITSLALAQRQHRLVTAERELLDQTLKGAVTVLSELLCLANPTAFSSSRRIKNVVVDLAEKLGRRFVWKFEIAALISQIGCISLPSSVLRKRQDGMELDEDERLMFFNHPKVGASLLENIPRIEEIVEMISLQFSSLEELNSMEDLDDEVKIGAQLLKIAGDYDLLLNQGESHRDAVKHLKEQKDLYDPEILPLLKKVKTKDEESVVTRIAVKDVTVGMIAEEDIVAKNGAMLTPKGQQITWAVLQGLRNFARKDGVKEPVTVRLKSS